MLWPAFLPSHPIVLLPHYYQALELEPGNVLATKIVQRLEPTVLERREKLKEEMLGEPCYPTIASVRQGFYDWQWYMKLTSVGERQADDYVTPNF